MSTYPAESSESVNAIRTGDDMFYESSVGQRSVRSNVNSCSISPVKRDKFFKRMFYKIRGWTYLHGNPFCIKIPVDAKYISNRHVDVYNIDWCDYETNPKIRNMNSLSITNAVMTPTAITPVSTSSVSSNSRKVAVFSAGKYVKEFIKPIERICKTRYIESCLDVDTAPLAEDCQAVNVFVNDDLSAPVLDILKECGVSTITLRCAGFDRLDVEHAKNLGFTVYRVPAYSPRSVAELALTHMMALSRNIQMVMPRVKTGNYTVEGLVGREVSGKTIGIVGTGKIAQEFVKLVKPMAGRIVAFDIFQSEEVKKLGVEYLPLEEVIREADVLSLHCPLMKTTHHMINEESLKTMKSNAVIINTARGGLINTEALIDALENGTIAGAAMDVYEHESGLFFTDRAVLAIEERMKFWDKKFARLAHLPNAIVSPHVAFLTIEALGNIADTTVQNLVCAFAGERNENMLY